MGADGRAWGRAEWLRGLPSVGLLVYEGSRASFEREGAPVVPSAESVRLGGPLGGSPVTHEAVGPLACPSGVARVGFGRVPPLAEALRRISPGFYSGRFDLATYAQVQQGLTTRLASTLAELPSDDFDVVWSTGETLRCALTAATASAATALWTAMGEVLAAAPASPFAGAIAVALFARPAPAPQLAAMLSALDRHPRCGVRAAALRLRAEAAGDDGARAGAAAAARAALRSPCWRLQAAALDVLHRAGAAPDAGVVVPAFLRRVP
jgi:hypothetical protein